MSDRLQEEQEAGIAPEEVTSTITDPEMDPQIICGCKSYCEGSCPVYNKYIKTKSLCLSSQAFCGYANRRTTLDEYLHLARLEVEIGNAHQYVRISVSTCFWATFIVIAISKTTQSRKNTLLSEKIEWPSSRANAASHQRYVFSLTSVLFTYCLFLITSIYV
jgi:hypothetical protein